MRLFLQGRVQGPELASLNRCRMYLQAIYVSDICTGDGQVIDPRFWDGREQCQMAYRWPRMECPTSNEWNMWHKTLTKALSLGRRDSLAKPLGNWTWRQGQQDGYFIESVDDHLVKKDKGQWYIYTKIPSRSRQQRFHEEARALPANKVKDNMWRAKVSIKTNVITVIGKAPIEQHSISTTTEEDVTEVDWGITNIQQGDLTQLEEAIKKVWQSQLATDLSRMVKDRQHGQSKVETKPTV